MTSKVTPAFRECFRSLPPEVRRQAVKQHRMWVQNPRHPSLQFKQLFPNVWSVRINDDYRAVARRNRDLIVWFWIGRHDEYNQIIRKS